MEHSAMSSLSKNLSSSSEDENIELRRGPWTVEEDTILIHYIARNGEGRWNMLAKRSGLKRTGKSCRLRWLNYLKPDVKRGNLTPQEQLLILELHSKWGNRWSKIAQHLPGRTDNEIKNYWRTRVQRQARHLKIDSNSSAFQEVIRCFWMPRLLQKIHGSASFSFDASLHHSSDKYGPLRNPPAPPPTPPNPSQFDPQNVQTPSLYDPQNHANSSLNSSCTTTVSSMESMNNSIIPNADHQVSDSAPANQCYFPLVDCDYYSLPSFYTSIDNSNTSYDMEIFSPASFTAACGFRDSSGYDQLGENEMVADGLWNMTGL